MSEEYQQFVDALENLNLKLDTVQQLNKNLEIANQLVSKLIVSLDPEYELDKILSKAYQGCHDFSDFVTNARKIKNYDVNLLRDWYDEQTSKLN